MKEHHLHAVRMCGQRKRIAMESDRSDEME